ncbi:uncharacterized protein V1516DRAFT_713579 [Lipomyces oligophaga]|uniref:uncharacterized protein n=1 Tax=Lipomyces oligophaga TaxID=45792 RepID=UPI0034CF7D06
MGSVFWDWSFDPVICCSVAMVIVIPSVGYILLCLRNCVYRPDQNGVCLHNHIACNILCNRFVLHNRGNPTFCQLRLAWNPEKGLIEYPKQEMRRATKLHKYSKLSYSQELEWLFF